MKSSTEYFWFLGNVMTSIREVLELYCNSVSDIVCIVNNLLILKRLAQCCLDVDDGNLLPSSDVSHFTENKVCLLKISSKYIAYYYSYEREYAREIGLVWNTLYFSNNKGITILVSYLKIVCLVHALFPLRVLTSPTFKRSYLTLTFCELKLLWK